MKNAALVLGSCLVACGATAGQSPPTSSPQPGVKQAITPTRTAVLFGGLERELVEAIQHHDAAALDRLLSEDFELRGNVHPGEAVAREDWQEAVQAAPPSTFRLSETAVHMAGDDTAIVSFAYEQQAKAKAPSGRFSFVDVWRRQEGAWRLEVRYAAPATDVPVPGLVAAEPEIPKEY
jgi:ketosteroid isomerase-like protein